uniref:Uncharacterized protein n=1 Tax=Zea mays TaxID=4577 RepID=A0A804MLE1_MAIZE
MHYALRSYLEGIVPPPRIQGHSATPLMVARLHSASVTRVAALQLRVRARRDRAVHEDAQRRAPAVRRDVRQLPAASPLQLRPREARPDAAGPAGHVPAAARERVVRDGPPRHAGGPGAGAGSREHGEQDGGCEDEAAVAAARRRRH